MANLKEYRVKRRFEVWTERVIEVADIETALATGKAMSFGDFFTSKRDVEVLDVTTLDGTGIEESW